MMQSAEGGQGSLSWRERFGEPRWFATFITWVLAAITVLKGLHRPSTWAYTQVQLNYSSGLIRRGFTGAVFGNLFGLNHLVHFWAFSYAALALALTLLVSLVRSSGLAAIFPEAHLPPLLASCFALTFFVQLAGFFDVLLLSLATVFLLVSDVRARVVLLPLLLAVGLLIHENDLLLFVPAMLLSFVIDTARRDRGAAGERQGLWIAANAATGAVALTFAIAFRATMTPEKALQIRHAVEARVDGPLNPGFWGVLTTSAVGNLHVIATLLRDAYVWTHILAPTMLIFLPVLGVLNLLNYRLSERMTSRRWLPVVCVAAGLSPLLLCALGTDFARWMTEATAASVLVLCSLCRRAGSTTLQVSPALRNFILLLIAVNLATGDQLMDGLRVNNYPFTNLVVDGAKAFLTRH